MNRIICKPISHYIYNAWEYVDDQAFAVDDDSEFKYISITYWEDIMIEKLACSLGRNDEGPNIALAVYLCNCSDKKAIAEIVDGP